MYLLYRKYHKEETRTKNIVKDFHYKASWYLATNFENICFPTFRASQIMMSDRLSAGVKRRLNMLSFYKLKCRMKEVTNVCHGGCVKHVGSEAYSSKMCGLCGRLNEDLGGSRNFKCAYSDCYFSSVEVPRDGNGAHNIEMLSYLHGAFPLSHKTWKSNKEFVAVGTRMTREGVLFMP